MNANEVIKDIYKRCSAAILSSQGSDIIYVIDDIMNMIDDYWDETNMFLEEPV